MGNTQYMVYHLIHYQDHPHIHGEHQAPEPTQGQQTGSPPHTWGTPDATHTTSPIPRITPTYMGNTVGSQQDPEPE